VSRYGRYNLRGQNALQGQNGSSLLDRTSDLGHRSDAGHSNVLLPASRKAERFVPPVPQRFADTGLSGAIIEQLILKFLYFHGELIASDLSRYMGLRFSLFGDVIEALKAHSLVQVKSSLGYGPISALLSLTETGRRVARDYLENNQYVGPAPVPIAQYAVGVEQQRMPAKWLTRERLAAAYSQLVMSDSLLDQIGPAISSGKSFLIYGQPGNGKTQIAEALANISTSDIYIPYALECQGNIIQLYDPIYHKMATRRNENESEEEFDGRWASCRRPFIASGGELSLSMLDLSYNGVSKIYDAPFQLKANNGIYLIDDFGRQKATSTEILNRWIVPMERRVDYLSFQNGGKVTVPFQTFLVFSTNLTPDKLGDEAFLRRIQYKMLLRSPDEVEYRTIFCKFAQSQNLSVSPHLLDSFIARYYRATGKQFRRCHPRDVISQAVDYIHFKRLPYELTEDLLDLAFSSCFPVITELTDT
jgi:energy-coupling factor transporter ATP-binding protein EcfA2